MGPVVAACARGAAGSRVADPRRATHLAGDQEQRPCQQPTCGQVLDQCREGPVELRQEVLLQAVEVVAVRIPAAGALALIRDGLILLPEDRDERDAGLHQPAGQEQAHAVDRLTVAFADARGLGRDVERRGGARGRQQPPCPLLEARPVAMARAAIEVPSRRVDGREQAAAVLEPLRRDPSAQRQGGRLEGQRPADFAVDIHRLVLDPQPRGELPRPGVGRLARPVRQRDRAGQTRTSRHPRGRHATDVGPVVRPGRPVVAQRLEARVRDVAGQVVIIPGMMVVGVDRRPHRVDHGQVMRLPGQHRQVLAEPDPGHRRRHRPERSSILGRRPGFMSHVSTCDAPPQRKNRIVDRAGALTGGAAMAIGASGTSPSPARPAPEATRNARRSTRAGRAEDGDVPRSLIPGPPPRSPCRNEPELPRLARSPRDNRRMLNKFLTWGHRRATRRVPGGRRAPLPDRGRDGPADPGPSGRGRGDSPRRSSIPDIMPLSGSCRTAFAGRTRDPTDGVETSLPDAASHRGRIRRGMCRCRRIDVRIAWGNGSPRSLLPAVRIAAHPEHRLIHRPGHPRYLADRPPVRMAGPEVTLCPFIMSARGNDERTLVIPDTGHSPFVVLRSVTFVVPCFLLSVGAPDRGPRPCLRSGSGSPSMTTHS